MVRYAAIPDLGSLTSRQLEQALHRFAQLGTLAASDQISVAQLEEQAHYAGVSTRTLRRYYAAYQQAGLAGLAPHARRDRDGCHRIAPAVVQQIETIRLSHRDAPVRHVHALATAWAATQHLLPPSLWQVRAVCQRIPPPVLALADGREATFRNRYRLTYPIAHPLHQMVWQLDHQAPIPVLVRGNAVGKKEVRPFLTTVIDSATRVIMGAYFSLTTPDRFTVAAAIREALLITEEHPYGGLPQAIWVDNGKDLLAAHVRQLVTGLGIDLVPGPPYQPQIRGIVERWHRTLETRLWSTVPGYCGPNIVARHPAAHAVLSLAELIALFDAFVAQYHNEVLDDERTSVGTLTRLAVWQRTVTPIPVDPRLLDVLLCEPLPRHVLKSGIKWGGQLYWDAALATWVGQDVLIRVPPSPPLPNTIQVYAQDHWIASATRVALGNVPRVTVAAAQQTQRRMARQHITTARQRNVSPSPAPTEATASATLSVHALLDRLAQQKEPPDHD